MKDYTNNEIKFSGCPACAYANHEFELPCGMAYENDNFTLSQDWELPIEGFFVVAPKRHVEKFEELSREERIELFDIVDKTVKILRENKICDRFDIIFEEKENRHFHVWIMPRHKWMEELVDDIIDEVGVILSFAKNNFRNDDVYKRIKDIVLIVKENI